MWLTFLMGAIVVPGMGQNTEYGPSQLVKNAGQQQNESASSFEENYMPAKTIMSSQSTTNIRRWPSPRILCISSGTMPSDNYAVIHM